MRGIFDLVKKVFSDWSEDRAPRLGAALAYYAVFSLAPLLVLLIGIAGLVFGQEAVEASERTLWLPKRMRQRSYFKARAVSSVIRPISSLFRRIRSYLYQKRLEGKLSKIVIRRENVVHRTHIKNKVCH